MLDKTYRPAEVEAKQYALEEASCAFGCRPGSPARPYTIMMPPPNVTGSLHMGHALTFTVQDILIRFERMRGRDALWQPGTDHAGIATQMVVERQLEGEGKARRSVGRGPFIERVWKWKEESGGTIVRQLRRLGASPDWARERFTMDEGLSAAVRKVFVDLYRKGLIYRDQRLVNWDPKLLTAISDLEVENREQKGSLWYIRYPIEGAPESFITVATTRPETMLGDTAIAVHPDDERYRALLGKHALLPLVGRRIPIVADSYSDPTKGSGAVKITPAHDFNDFEVGRRHKLEMVNILDAHGRVNEAAPTAYRGLDRFEARKRVVADLEALGLIEKIEPHSYTVPYGDRSGVVIEPWLTVQWYANAEALARPAIAAVESGRTRFVPEHWAKTYYEWMRNIQPWCISRQLWWGHQIPAWYGPDGQVFVAPSEAEAEESATLHYGRKVALKRDEDVLDTWFSSALWPFSTLGWPERTPELARYYPSDVLVTGFDIIFFWVARMMMMGIEFMGDVPFHTVYIHALVRDERGQKMSKTKGNIIDPLDLIDQFGCDALRFTLAALAAQGRDIRLSPARVESSRNFATKLWNAARYALINECKPDPRFDAKACVLPVNRWIVTALADAIQRTGEAFETYRFNEAANTLYQFAWGTFCDWYLEFTKPVLASEDAAAKAETRACTAWVMGQLLHLLHPIMPFLTEELWPHFRTAPEGMLISAAWPVADLPRDDVAAADMEWVVQLVSDIRAVRAEMNVPVAAKLELKIRGADPQTTRRMAAQGSLVSRLARLSGLADEPAASAKGAAQIVLAGVTYLLPLAGVIDLAAEQTRLEREGLRLEGEVKRIDQKLSKADFVAKAPPEIVEENRERRAGFVAERARILEALRRLTGDQA
jgi:valyl-tRNA synthetase